MSSSLAYPSPSFQPRRNLSQNAQLPLPSTLSAQSPTRAQFNTNAPNGTTNRPNSAHSMTATLPQTPQRSRGMSLLANRALGANFSPNSPHSVLSSPHNRSTHAGGIQPAMSFFRPSRPDYQDTYSRRSSFASSDEVTEHAAETDGYALSRLSPVGPPIEPDVAPEVEEIDLETAEEGIQVDDQEETLQEENARGELNRSIGRGKHSKEPLLPIGGRPGGHGPRRNVSGSQRPMVGLGVTFPKGSGSQGGGKRLSGGSIMKTSIDRVFSLRRGLSIDSIRRSMQETEEGRLTPIKDGIANVRHSSHFRCSSASPSTPRYKHTSGHYQGTVKRHSHSLSVSQHTPISPSPDPSFISQPPEGSAPLSRIPVKDFKTGRVVRRYERHPSRNRFFFRGHLLTGGDSPWAFMICLVIVLGLAGVWFATTCVWWWHNESPAVAAVGAYMALLAISSMLATVIEYIEALRTS